MSDLRISLNNSERVENAFPGIGLPRDIAEADLETSSIPAAWLVSGEAQTRSKFLGNTRDRLAYAMYWECGASKFNWHYSKDEFLFILSGDVFVTEKDGGERHYGPSDFIFFSAGSDATWRVPDHLTKIAILKSPVSRPLVLLSKSWNKLLEITGLSSNVGL